LSQLELEKLRVRLVLRESSQVSWVDLDRFATLESWRNIDSEWKQSRWDAVVGTPQETQADE
jgi:hypothetical protein